mmetsp:Transcript_6837/g.12696  ORF Transcript_6837/g.12696 Transcript_6837/m.12696 type:complete len:238 (+) Transcript_6837:481-1194(+)
MAGSAASSTMSSRAVTPASTAESRAKAKTAPPGKARTSHLPLPPPLASPFLVDLEGSRWRFSSECRAASVANAASSTAEPRAAGVCTCTTKASFGFIVVKCLVNLSPSRSSSSAATKAAARPSTPPPWARVRSSAIRFTRNATRASSFAFESRQESPPRIVFRTKSCVSGEMWSGRSMLGRSPPRFEEGSALAASLRGCRPTATGSSSHSLSSSERQPSLSPSTSRFIKSRSIDRTE